MVDLTVATGRAGRRGLRFHRATLLDDEVALLDGLPVTTPARTVADLATVLPRRDLVRLVDDVLIGRLATYDELVEAAGRAAGRSGVEHLRAALHMGAGAARARSRAERRLRALAVEAGLPEPESDAEVAGHLCDLVWRDLGLVVEFDSWTYHWTPERFARDRRRHNDLQAAGLALLRVTEDDLEAPAALQARVLRAAAGRSRWSGRPA